MYLFFFLIFEEMLFIKKLIFQSRIMNMFHDQSNLDY